jgi:hypothetical protein
LAKIAAALTQKVPSMALQALREANGSLGRRLKSGFDGARSATAGTMPGDVGVLSGSVGAFRTSPVAGKRHAWRFFRQRRRFARHGWRVSRRRKAEKPLESGSPGVA